jgi:hypothetical protein
MSEHAFLAPSAAARWSVCPGSALMESRYPEQGDKTAAAEGTAAHWCMQQLFAGFSAETLLQDGKTETGHPVTAEMVEGAQMLVDDVRETLAPFGVQPIVERRVNIPRVHPSANWGTPDVRAWVGFLAAQERFLHIWDYKHGHKHVEVFENKQLIDYAAGCLTEANEHATANGVDAWPEDRITVVLRVVQPRSYHRDGPIREWRIGNGPTPLRLRAVHGGRRGHEPDSPPASRARRVRELQRAPRVRRPATRGLSRHGPCPAGPGPT